ncbi:uncharacterized protein [Procambarus clarkii]|uniref:uncharacterized protein n=1 Tax=Procambarus clarkii TaxID=6728 RepID=UPI0037449FA4
MRLLVVLSVVVVAVAGQFTQGRRTFNSARRFPPAGGSPPFVRFDDDFDDFDDDADFFDNDRDDSLEDLYDDLYDDDARDRAQARAALTRLRASGAITGNTFRNNRFVGNRNNAFRSTGFTNTGFVNRFPNTRTTSFNTNTARPNNLGFRSSFRPTPTTPSPAFFGGTSNSANRFGGPSNNFNSLDQPFSNSIQTSSPFTNKITSAPAKFSGSSANTFKTSSSSPFKTLPSGFNWPGGNGYFFSMSTLGADPVTYFISYDD